MTNSGTEPLRHVESTGPERSPVATGLVGKAIEIAGLALLVSLVPRILGPEHYGAFALGLTIVTIVSAAISAGGSPTLARFVPAASSADRRAVARAMAERLLPRRALAVGTVALVAALCTAAFPDTFPPLTTGLLVLAIALDVAATLCFQVALGLGRYRTWSSRYPLQNILLAVMAIVLGTHAGRTGAIVALVIASGGALLVGVISGVAPLRDVVTASSVPAQSGRFARYLGASSLLLLVTHRSGIVIVALLAGARETGYAALAIGVGLAAVYAVQQIFLLQLAALARYAGDTLPLAERQAGRLAKQALAVLSAVALVGAGAVERVIPAVLGQSFVGAEAALVPVLVLLPVIPLAALATQLASLHLRAKTLAGASACGLVVFLLAAPAAVAVWGAPGATGSLVASTMASVAFLAWMLPRLVPMSLYVGATLSAGGALLIAILT